MGKIADFYAGKTILITGCTGFIGKVMLEKFLRDLPSIGRIYILVRAKNGNAARDRCQKDIADSPCFDRLRSEMPNFDEFFHSKVIGIPGDLMNEKLGLSSEMWAQLSTELEAIISCAASVNFNEPLATALRLNVLGPLRLLDLALNCKRMHVFLHVSTAYTGSAQTGMIDERLHQVSPDPEATLLGLLDMNAHELAQATPQLIGQFPNTYTFTKCLCEHLIQQRRGKLSTVLVRPTIVGAAAHEPMPGWVDNVSAASALFLSAGFGILTFAHGQGRYIGDQIPVDYVSNFIISVVPVMADSGEMDIFHYGTSHRNPVTWMMSIKHVIGYWRRNPPLRKVSESHFSFKATAFLTRLELYMSYVVPSKFIDIYSKIQPQYKSLSQQYQRVTRQVDTLTRSFAHFTNNEWIFLFNNADRIINALDDEERKRFYIDVRNINWALYLQTFCYGLQRYTLKEDVRLPSHATVSECLLSSDYGKNMFDRVMDDINWAVTQKMDLKVEAAIEALRPTREVRELVVQSDRVQNTIRRLAAEKGRPPADLEKEAHTMIERMAADLKPGAIRGFAYVMRNVWRKLYRGIMIEEEGMNKARVASQRGPIIFIPTHRSYVDFLILSYVCFAMGLPMPHIAAGEDFLHIFLVSYLLRYSGAFFMRRDFGGDQLYRAVFHEYCRRTLIEGHPMEFFLEGTRSRSGKLLQPKMGILSIVVDTFLEDNLDTISIIPLGINYEKTLEGPMYTNEMLGSKKIKESLSGIFKASSILNMNFGRIDVRFGDPIPLSEYANNYRAKVTTPELSRLSTQEFFADKERRKGMVSVLGYDISRKLNASLMAMPTHIVSAILLMYRGGISVAQLVGHMDWVHDAIVARGGEVALSNLQYALMLLGRLVVERRKTMIEPEIHAPHQAQALTLAMYRNQLLHFFYEECVVTCTVAAMAKDARQPVDRTQLFQEAQTLRRFMKKELIYTVDLKDQRAFQALVDVMITRGVLTGNVGGATVAVPEHDMPFRFICSLLWPFIDTYYIVGLGLFALQEDQQALSRHQPYQMATGMLLDRMQWLSDKLFTEHKTLFYEAISIEAMRNAISVYIDMGVIKKALVGRTKEEMMSLVAPYNQEQELMRVVKQIGAFRNVPDVSHPFGVHGTATLDYRVLSRL